MSYDTVGDAVTALEAAMKGDPGLAWAWHCNIAVAMQDEGVSHTVSNAGAARFMKTAFGVDTSKAPMPETGAEETIEYFD